MPSLASAVVLALAGPVQWQAPAGCPTAAAVEGRVQELLGRVPAEHELRAVGVVSGGPPWRLELETTIGDRLQRRVLEAEDCHAVAEAAALILAVSVDPVGLSQAPATAMTSDVPPPEAAGSETAGSEAVGSEAAGSEAAGSEAAGIEAAGTPVVPLPASLSTRTGRDERSAPRARPRPSLRLRLGGGGEAVAIPGGTGGVRLGLALEGERAFIRLEGGYWIDRLAVLRAEPTPSGARVGLGTVAAQGGLWLGGPRVTVPLALGLEAGGLRTRAEGLVGGRDVVLPWLAGVVGVGLQWSVSRRVALWGAVEGVLPLLRLRVRVGRGDPGSEDVDILLHEPAVVGARALAGISIEIVGGP